ncbi:MAG: tetratricopeptide repeat protein [Pyrinomonadaceae bacterium]
MKVIQPKISLIFVLAFAVIAFSQTSLRTITVKTAPNAKVWIDGVLRGTTDETGELKVFPVIRGSKSIRVRADGFAEQSKPIVPKAATVQITLQKTFDPAELAFQEGERALETDSQKAALLYKKAISLRKNYAEANVALARVLSTTNSEGAHAAIAAARKIRPVYPEASAVEGRIYRDNGDLDNAIDSFDRAVKEGKGFQPEALTGLGLLFKGEAEESRTQNDTEYEKFYYNEAAKNFEAAINQLAATEPVVYFLLGEVYERLEQPKKAIAVYQRFLKDFPKDEERMAAESMIKQLLVQLEEGNN